MTEVSRSIIVFFEFVTWPPFTEMYDASKKWPSDKFREKFETFLKVHCCAAIMKYLDAWHPLNNKL